MLCTQLNLRLQSNIDHVLKGNSCTVWLFQLSHEKSKVDMPVNLLVCSYSVHVDLFTTRAAGICIGIGPIPAYFDFIGIGQVHYTSTNSVVCAILIVFFQLLS